MDRYFFNQDQAGNWFAVNTANRAQWSALIAEGAVNLEAVPEYAVHIENLDQFEFRTFYYPNQPGGTL